MANIASAKKRILVTAKKEMENQMLTSKLKTMLKKYDAAIKANDLLLLESLIPSTVGFIDNLELKGILHKNNANRKKAAIAKKFDNLKAKTAAVKAE